MFQDLSLGNVRQLYSTYGDSRNRFVRLHRNHGISGLSGVRGDAERAWYRKIFDNRWLSAIAS